MTRKLKQIIVLFMILFSMSTIFSVESKAIDFTDVGDINDGFVFDTTNNGSSDDNDMKFQGAQSSDPDDFWNTIYAKYRSLITLVSGVLSLGFVGIFIINITKYGSSAGNPQTRSQAIKTLLWTGVGAALFGAVTIISAMSYTFLM